jgi:hypothetical protein
MWWWQQQWTGVKGEKYDLEPLILVMKLLFEHAFTCTTMVDMMTRTFWNWHYFI